MCLIDSDSPTLPAGALRAAVTELARTGERVVLGPSEDGGYYLIGMKRAEPRFERITWSTERVYAETAERVRGAGVELVELPKWYDVDDAAMLAVLERELLTGEAASVRELCGFDAGGPAVLAERVGAVGKIS